MQKLLTIVIPVYKVEPYINKCLDSCLIYKTNEQEEKVLDEELMNQLEVIIVNDGTPDRSAEMSRKYVKHYPQTFRQIDKENGGHGSAWNVGLKETTGRYLRFLDSDDWLTNLDRLICCLAEIEADLVFTNERVWDNNELLREEPCCDEYDKLQPISKLSANTFYGDIRSLGFRKCTYKTSVLKSLQPLFREHVCYDDTILYVAPLLNAESYIAFDYVVYNLLRGREEQSMNINTIKRNAKHVLRAYLDMHGFIERNSFRSEISPVIREVENKEFNYCAGVFALLPYHQRKDLIKALYERKPQQPDYGKLARRYSKLPFFVAWFVDEVRVIKQKFFRK